MNVIKALEIVNNKIEENQNLIDALEIHANYYRDIMKKVIEEFGDSSMHYKNDIEKDFLYLYIYNNKKKDEIIQYVQENFHFDVNDIWSKLDACTQLQNKYKEELELLTLTKYIN